MRLLAKLQIPMLALQARLVLALLCLLLASGPLCSLAQPVFEQSKVEFEHDLYRALEVAISKHQGDILIFFYERGDAQSRRIVNNMFADEAVSRYINDNFAPCAVEIGSNEWARMMERYRRGSPADWPFVLVDIRRFLSHATFHGWGNPGSTHQRLEKLMRVKEQGAFTAPVEEWVPDGTVEQKDGP